MPQYIASHLKDYKEYRELGNIFFLELNINKEIPFCFLFKKNDDENYKYLIYKKDSIITKINLEKNKPFDFTDLNDYIDEQINGSLFCHYINLIK